MSNEIPTVAEQELKAWMELKQAIGILPASDLATFFHGTVTERDDLMDKHDLARETWWLIGVLRVCGDDG